ncbi:MAG: hypothetical protein OHK0015_32480 [Chloroflexi bacterium OHK40]
MSIYADAVFAPIDRDLALERVAGGNETEVYRSDDGRFVAKLKHELGGSSAEALAEAKRMRAAADAFAACLGPRYSIPSYHLLARDSEGRVQILVVQPYLHGARPLCTLNYRAMPVAERQRLARELRAIIRRAEAMLLRTGSMPDLYGRTSGGRAERHVNRSLRRLPQRLWSFLVQRTILRSHNLLYTADAERPVVLVDYDFVRQGLLYRAIYYLMRLGLFWRDRVVIRVVLEGGARRAVH